MDAPHAVVIGGGMAGLAAAFGLRQEGCHVTLLESADAPGGRARSEQVDGFHVDTSAPVLWSTDRHVARLMQCVGLVGSLVPLRPLALQLLHGDRLDSLGPTGLRGLARVPGVHSVRVLRNLRLARLFRRYADRLDPDRPERGAALDDRSVADFGRLYFGRSAAERGIGPALSSTSLCDESETSRLLFLLDRRAHGFATPGTPRGAGIARFCERLAESASLHLKARVEQLVEHSDGRFTVHFQEDGATACLDADVVVLATPVSEAARVAAERLDPAERDFLAGRGYRPGIVVALGVEGSLAGRATRICVPHVEGWPVNTISLEPGGPGERVPEGRELVLMTATPEFSQECFEAEDAAILDRLLPLLERLHPGAGDRLVLRRVYRHGLGLPRFDVGTFRAIDRFQRVQRDLRARGRRLYFAGDYLVGPSIESALSSGLRAAAAIREDLVGERAPSRASG